VLFDCGGICASAIENCFAHDLPATECGLSGERSNGNGSLMRIYPFSLIAYHLQEKHGLIDELIDQASALTHAHERARLGCRIYTRVLQALLETPEKSAIKAALRESKHRYADSSELAHYERLCSPDFDTLPRKSIKSTGYIVDTLEAAIWCVLTTNSYQECVCKAVNLGEDTDTVAAVAGSLAGALYGYGAIPEEWLNTLKRRDYIEELCEKLCKAW
jgi:ADP-ribosylglycohydrolase